MQKYSWILVKEPKHYQPVFLFPWQIFSFFQSGKLKRIFVQKIAPNSPEFGKTKNKQNLHHQISTTNSSR
jgi:hypothetical protein